MTPLRPRLSGQPSKFRSSILILVRFVITRADTEGGGGAGRT